MFERSVYSGLLIYLFLILIVPVFTFAEQTIYIFGAEAQYIQLDSKTFELYERGNVWEKAEFWQDKQDLHWIKKVEYDYKYNRILLFTGRYVNDGVVVLNGETLEFLDLIGEECSIDGPVKVAIDPSGAYYYMSYTLLPDEIQNGDKIKTNKYDAETLEKLKSIETFDLYDSTVNPEINAYAFSDNGKILMIGNKVIDTGTDNVERTINLTSIIDSNAIYYAVQDIASSKLLIDEVIDIEGEEGVEKLKIYDISSDELGSLIPMHNNYGMSMFAKKGSYIIVNRYEEEAITEYSYKLNYYGELDLYNTSDGSFQKKFELSADYLKFYQKSPDSNLVIYKNGSDNLVIINLDTLEVEKTLDLDFTPVGVAFVEDTSTTTSTTETETQDKKTTAEAKESDSKKSKSGEETKEKDKSSEDKKSDKKEKQEELSE